MHIYATANLQLGRPNAISLYGRTFDQAQSQVEDNPHVLDQLAEKFKNLLIDNWNSTIDNNSQVYVLGNLGHEPKTLIDVLPKLNGKQITILEGEYDQPVKQLAKQGDLPANVELADQTVIVDHEHKLCLSYWPLAEWPGKTNDYFSVIGYPDKTYQTSVNLGRLNACIDFQPDYSIPEIVNRTNSLREVKSFKS